MNEWVEFINKPDKNDFEQQLADIMSEALAKLDSMTDEELERLADCD
jgi:hypothetical protein